MPEFLVRVGGARQLTRVIAQDLTEVASSLEDWSHAVVYSTHGRVCILEPGRMVLTSHRRLPMAVRLAWLGVRRPRVRLTFQISCWMALVPVFAIRDAQGPFAPAPLLLVGLANIFAWWWSESDRGRIHPGVRHARAP